MSELDAGSVLEGNSIFTEFEGALTEQYVLQQMLSDTAYLPYYFSPSTHNEKYLPKYAVRTSMADYKEQDWLVNLPLYALHNL